MAEKQTIIVKLQVNTDDQATQTDLRALVALRNSIKDQLQMAKRQGRSELEIGGLQWQLQKVKGQIAATGASPLEIIEAGKRKESAPVVDPTRPHRIDRDGKKTPL